MFELRPLSSAAIPAALAKAERYRLLNEPSEAESICLDILAIEPDAPGRSDHDAPRDHRRVPGRRRRRAERAPTRSCRSSPTIRASITAR
jgi:hypothetical protein